jgi:hypothetical protein
MIQMIRCLRALLLLLPLFAAAIAATDPMPERDRTFLDGYERIRAALAADDLQQARDAATAVPEAEILAKSSDLTSARKEFRALSNKAVSIARGQPGYYVVRCNMFPGGAKWVQKSEDISNPYCGRSMPRCGSIEK